MFTQRQYHQTIARKRGEAFLVHRLAEQEIEPAAHGQISQTGQIFGDGFNIPSIGQIGQSNGEGGAIAGMAQQRHRGLFICGRRHLAIQCGIKRIEIILRRGLLQSQQHIGIAAHEARQKRTALDQPSEEIGMC